MPKRLCIAINVHHRQCILQNEDKPKQKWAKRHLAWSLVYYRLFQRFLFCFDFFLAVQTCGSVVFTMVYILYCMSYTIANSDWSMTPQLLVRKTVITAYVLHTETRCFYDEMIFQVTNKQHVLVFFFVCVTW